MLPRTLRYISECATQLEVSQSQLEVCTQNKENVRYGIGFERA